MTIEEFKIAMRNLYAREGVSETRFALDMMKLAYEAGSRHLVEWDEIELAMFQYDDEVGA